MNSKGPYIPTIALYVWWMLERIGVLSYARPIGRSVAESCPTGLGSSTILMEFKFQSPDWSKVSIATEVNELYV